MLHPLREENLHKLLGILLHGAFPLLSVFFTYSFIYLYRYELMDMYFMLRIIKPNAITFVDEIFPDLAIENS